MATRSRLRANFPNGKTASVYCHWDGYPSHQLPILNKFYDTNEKVEELLALGSLSYLAERVKPEPGESHSFDNPAPGVVVAYHRDRGEKLVTEHKFREEYDYLWDGKKWSVV